MDTHRDNLSRHPTAALFASLGNPPTTPLPPLPPLTLLIPQPSVSQPSPTSELVDSQTDRHLREEVTPLFRTWEPTPENISELLRCSSVRFPQFDDVPSGNGVQQPSSSTSSEFPTPPRSKRQSPLHASLTAAAFASAAITDLRSSTTQLSTPTEQTEANKSKSSFFKLVQPIPPQSRTFFKNVPFLHRLSYAGSVDLCGSGSGNSSAGIKATVDPFDSNRDVLSKVYILTTSAHGAANLAHLSGQQQQQQQQQLPPKYLLKVFPDKTLFKHAATRTDPINSDDKSSSSRVVLRMIIQDAIEHELGAIEWAQKFLRRTTTPNVLGYSLPFDRPTELPGDDGEGEGTEVTGVEKYGILGFILMEFPAEGILYQGPLEEFQTKKAQGVEMGEGFAKILYEMRSASCNTRVAGFSIHRRMPADDGSSKVVDGVSKPYNRFDLIVDELRRKDAKRMAGQLSLNLSDAATAHAPSTPSFTNSGTGEPSQYKSDSTNKLQANGGGANATAEAANEVPHSDSTITSQSSSSASSSLVPAPALIRPFLAPVKDLGRLSLLIHVHKKTIERKMSAGEIPETAPQMPSLASPSIPVDAATTVDTTAITAAVVDGSQANVVDSEADEPAPPRQMDPTRQETPQDDILQTIAKRLVNASSPPSDALEACRRMSQSEKHHQFQSTAPASLASLEMLATGTMRRVMEPKKLKLSIRPSSTISVAGCLRVAPYTWPPMKASPPKTWPDVCFSSKATVVRRQPVTTRTSCCFDADASVYCSSRAQERYLDGRGEISRLVAKISGDLVSPSIASSDPLTTSTETKNISWPKDFIEPTNFKDGKPVYDCVADYEYARLVNALVALERLDSTPGSMNRFPKALIALLPRILRLAHQKDILFSHTHRMGQKRSGDRGKQPPFAITNAATQAAIFTPPSPSGLFEGIESVFTHGQMAAQGSLVTDRQRRGVVALANFQKAGFLPPYEEDMRGLFVKKVYSSFWNVFTASSDDNLEDEGGRGGGGGGVEKGQAGREGKTQSRMRKTASKIWPFKRFSKLSTFTTASSPDAIPLKSFAEDEEDNEYNVHAAAQMTMPARSVSIHGKHPVPYPLLNHAIEHGSSCGSRYMVLVEARSSMLSTSTSTSLTSSLSTDSLATDSSLAHGLETSKRFSVASPGLTPYQIDAAPLAATSASDTLAEGVVMEKSGNFSRMKSQFKARFVSKTKKNKTTYDDDNDDDNEQDPGWVTIEELIQDPAVSGDLFPLSSIADATIATTATKATEAGSPALECFPSSSSASALLPSPPPQRSLMTELPTFHTAPSSLSLSLSIPRSGNSARSTTSQGTLLPEETKICKVGWSHFLKTYCALETKALRAAAAAVTASDGANINDHTHTGASNQNAIIDSPSTSTCPTPISFAFSTIKFKESTYFHNHQLRSLTDTINNRSNSMLVLESLISLSKTLQNLVVALEVGGIVLTPEQLLMAISERQQEWQRNEDKRLAQIENDKERARELRIQAGERQEREQEERMAELERQKQQMEQQQREQKEQLEEKQQQGQQGQQKGKQQWWQDDEIIPPEVPPKDDPPAVPPKDNSVVLSFSCADTDTDIGAEMGSVAQAVLSQTKSPRFGMLKVPSFLSKQKGVAGSTSTTPTASVARRISHLFGLSLQSQPSLLTSSSVSKGLTASTASAYHYHGRTPEYFIRGPDDDILYSAPGLQRDPLPSELPDHIMHSSTVTTTGSTFANGTSLFDSPVVYDTDLHHKLGTMIAPSLPAYGIRLSNPDRTKTLAQVEAERIEREMQTFWRELEALCENEGQTSWRAPPGIALLSITELEKQIEDVEQYVAETKEGRRSHLL
ncbi:hypothetical protein BG015_009977 [Linnemannia schmuckeri]|uniref:Uncharacterized protein n=1 Tax=Linnemannia schmuckeri TaxID=64567 RepID=A0A9P5V9E0_9FUNG|nr:hypothetical protein BG015_009977 [Linnemannia schmuckeri]